MVAVLAVVLVLPALALGAPKQPVNEFGGTGSNDGNLVDPWDVAIDQDTGNVYVVDNGNDRVSVFDQDGAFLFKFGSTGSGKGELSDPRGIAIDQSADVLYVTDEDNFRVQKFDLAGHFLAMWGWGVADGTVALQTCLAAAASCQTGISGSGDGQFLNVFSGQVAVAPDGSPNDGRVYVADSANERIQVFTDAGAFVAKFGTAGTGNGQFAANWPKHLAIDSAGTVYASDGTSASQSRVQKFDSTHAFTGTVSGLLAATTTGNDGLAVNPANDHLFVLRDPSSGDSVVQEFDAVGSEVADSPHGDGQAFNTNQGIAVNATSGEIYIGRPQSATIDVVTVLGDVAGPLIASLNAASAIETTSATLNATIDPNGSRTRFHFEISPDGVDFTPVPNADVDAGKGVGPQSVSAAATGLEPGTVYRMRLVVTRVDGSSFTSAEQTFLTDAATDPPQVSDLLPVWVDETSATLRAKVDPNGTETSYHFEVETAAGEAVRRIPADHELSAGQGLKAVSVAASPSGLMSETAYRFRVVAENAFGSDTSADQPFETLNEDGLIQDRRFELVSPVDKGPGGDAGQELALGGTEMQYQAAQDGKSMAYVVSFGTPTSTHGGEVAFRSDLIESGWLPSQVSPSMVGTPPNTVSQDGSARGSYHRWLSADLSCGFAISALPLTDDAAALPVIEAGGFNLYRRNPDGSHDLVSNIVPTNHNLDLLIVDTYDIRGASEDCNTVVFETRYAYPGIPSTAADGGRFTYVWRNGVLGNPFPVPTATGPQYTNNALLGTMLLGGAQTYHNAVSRDGSRVFFSSQKSGTSEDQSPRFSIFLNEEGGDPIEVSASQTATANDGNPRYQTATPDGEHVFFIGRYGLAPNGSSAGATGCSIADGNNLGIGCDLYRYTVSTGELRDLSVSANPDDTSGASVAGVVAASADGRHVYFLAKGRLVPGKGRTFAENTAAATRGYNLYHWNDGVLAHVASVDQGDVNGAVNQTGGLLVASPGNESARYSSRATPDGEFLLFQSAANITGPSGTLEAYRYSAETGTVVCVSCRRDGLPSLGSHPYLSFNRPLSFIAEMGGSSSYPMRSMSDDGSTIFFRKRDPLAPGAVSGEVNLYEWHDGQISHIVADVPGTSISSYRGVAFLGAGSDGDTVFFRSFRPLVPQDTDGGHNDVYAARVGGGFDPPSPPPEPCDVLADECHNGGGDVPVSSNQRTSVAGGQDGNAVAGARKTLGVATLSARARAQAARTGRLSLRIRVNQPGSVAAVARSRIGARVRRVARTTVRIRRAGAARVTLRLSPLAKRRLKAGRNLRLSIQVRSAGARTKTISVRLLGGLS